MRRSDFDYALPPELIAQFPLEPRSASRLLVLGSARGHDPQPLIDARFADLPQFLMPGDLLVLNNTRVIPARLYGRKPGGGKLEALVERILDECRLLAQLRGARALRPGQAIEFSGTMARIVGRRGEFFELEFDLPDPSREALAGLLDRIGHTPLPPYIRRTADRTDQARYQTIYAQTPGAVAAPTAGLHFDAPLFTRLQAHGVEWTFVTLHVGAGTFQPMRSAEIDDHRMHQEYFEIGAAAGSQINNAKAAGRRVVAVGTTVVRALESAARGGTVQSLSGETTLFIYPGYRFSIVDALLTNFHLPESTLLMLICAFGGRERVMHAYRHAVQQRYRFFSYGDAMLVVPPV